MAEARNGDIVRVHYTGTLDSGGTFDTSADRDPLEFRLGDGHLIPGFERAVVGMNAGESKTVKISAGEAYGARREELVTVVARSDFPEGIEPEVGLQLRMQTEEGGELRVEVTAVSEEAVTLDGNHPLAGEDLTFEIKLVDIG